MFSDERFDKLKARFGQVKKEYMAMVGEKRKTAAKTIVSNGCLYNVLPFENELNGEKVNGKIIPKPIPHNNCFIYRLDESDRVSLVENMSDFLEAPAFFSLYAYSDDRIEHVYGDNTRPYRVKWAYLEPGGRTKEILCFDKVFSIDIFEYTESVLTQIRFLRETKGGHSFDLKFHYDEKAVLQAIHRVWQTGSIETVYSTAKANFKALGQRLFADTGQAVSDFLRQHESERLTRFALDAYTGHGYLSLCMDTGLDDRFKYSPADWEYCDFRSLPLVEFPLDDKQSQKLRKTLVQLARDLLESDCLRNLTASPTFKILVFDHNGLIAEKPKTT